MIALRRVINLALVFFLIEVYDELVGGVQNAAIPSMRTDLALTYAQVGLLLGMPKIINTFIEPLIMLLGDSALRKRLVIGGGLTIALSLLLISSATAFLPLLFAFIIYFPASGAFVSLSQATLMDLNPGREPHSMARWSVYGSLGALLGPALLSGGFAIGLGWRLPYLGLALLALGLVLMIWGKPFPPRHEALGDHAPSWRETPRWMWDNLTRALRIKALLGWVTLLELSDLLLDVFTSYTALYFADVVGLNPAQTGLVLTVLMLTSLGCDLLLIPLLERVPGRKVVRTSAALAVPTFIAFLLVPWAWAKVALMVGVRLSTIGWYPVMQGEAYAAAPGRSGTVAAINSLAGLFGGAIIWFIGVVANQAGLTAAMWLLLAGPLALAFFVPRAK
jgi:MFS transporter, FSR family, fosmidomycin resistance protein